MMLARRFPRRSNWLWRAGFFCWLLFGLGQIGLNTFSAASTSALARAQEPFPKITFAAIGDSGTGGPAQFAVARAMEQFQAESPFELVLMLGDNFYGGVDFTKKFEQPYEKLLTGGVQFYAVLGNHDGGKADKEMNYPKLHMGGQRYYTFTRGQLDRQPLAQFFALDSSDMDTPQLAWLDQQLGRSRAHWKIAFFHHPLYSSGKTHGPALKLRTQLEPLFIQYGVQLVLNGHEHFYERLRPRQGVQYFISGAAGKLRRNNLKRNDPDFVFGNDQVQHFMLFEATPATLRFRAISDAGAVLDSGTLNWTLIDRASSGTSK
jgi:hypothetical protein